jgi:sporulation protein YlmC with PRC-barrel domain
LLTAEIDGKEVIGSEGALLGKVVDIQFDEKTWGVLAVEVHLEKDVAEEHQLRHRLRKTLVLVRVEHIQAVGDKVILKGSKEDLLTLIASSAGVQSPAELTPSELSPTEQG